MKNSRISSAQRGFTLMELMVAMAITTIIVTVLVSITSIALDTWNRSRSELRASRQAKSMIDIMSRDFEALVTRRGNKSEWLAAVVDPDLDKIGDNIKSTNASRLVFFSAVTDRYEGKIGDSNVDKGGDVSCVAYQLIYKDPIEDPIDPSTNSKFKTFVLNRLLVNPDDTFKDLLGKTDSSKPDSTLDKVFAASTHASKLTNPENFVSENIFQFSTTFHLQVTTVPASGTTPATVVNVPVTIGSTADVFGIGGTGIRNDYSGSGATAAQVAAGRVVAVEISVTVVSDFGIDQSKTRSFADDQARAEFLAKNSYQYTKLVQLPSM